jgi:hypothetical protein
MAAATPDQANALRWRPGDVVVTRHVRVPAAKLVRRLPDPDGAPKRLPLPGGELAIAQRLGVATGTSSWRARGKLRPRRRRLVPFPPIEIEIVPWSHSASELRIIPLTRFAHRWGVHRMRGYTELASAAADRLISLCSASIAAVLAGSCGQSASATDERPPTPSERAQPSSDTGPSGGHSTPMHCEPDRHHVEVRHG